MKEEALKLADELQDYMTSLGWKTYQAPAMIRRLVEELDKQGKPKAWIREDGVIAFFKQKEIDDQGFKWQPLYLAPQTKPLSDEEIMEIFKAYEQMQEYGYVGKKPFQVHLGWSLEDKNSCLMLARAIEEMILNK